MFDQEKILAEFLEQLKSDSTHKAIQDEHAAGVSTDIYSAKTTLGSILNGRYRLDRILGSGAFGTVYLAQDLELNRQVALKIQIRGDRSSSESNDDYLAEAKFSASLRHPHILTVYTVDRTSSNEVFIVTEYIEGGTLKDRIESNDLDYRQIAKIIQSVAEALYHAHQRGLIHRDVKPANILIEHDTLRAYVVDFGLATREYEYLQKGYGAGSPAYKSPEQVRRAGHRLDGRSDLFSLGIVFYELLCGQRPFRGGSIPEIEKRIESEETLPPSSIKSGIPDGLERICMKLLRKEPSHRYPNGLEVANELRNWRFPKTTADLSIPHEMILVTPRGLRTFTDEDAGFFLDLLPGARDRVGLPESIAFWKKRIEQNDPDKTFSVGLINGPSGSGKSSLVRAGIMPQLSRDIVAIHVDATSDDTEIRLVNALHKRIPETRGFKSLVQTLTHIRNRSTHKVVLFIDQFEQWLSSHRNTHGTELVDALRKCDGQSLQAILMVREDFGAAIKFLADDLNTTIDKERNYAWVDLFDPSHAKQVLMRFGQAYGKLPQDLDRIGSEQTRFVETAIRGLAQNSQDGGVIPVQLALFADMVKNKVWEVSTLDGIGGTTGVVLNFLDESFSARNPQNLIHQNGARGVLKALMPPAGSDIKGHQRSEDELLEASGYTGRPTDFRRLLRILDNDLRLIRPSEDQDSHENTPLGAYQLTHDYLVPSLREWLTRKQRETPKGRAELKLADLAKVWASNREVRQLPTIIEWFNIHRWTERRKWIPIERSMMLHANKYYLSRFSIVCSLLMVMFASAALLKLRSDYHRLDETASTMVKNIESFDIEGVQKRLSDIRSLGDTLKNKLLEAIRNSPEGSDKRLNYNLALLGNHKPAIDELARSLPKVDSKQISILIEALRPYRADLIELFWSQVQEQTPQGDSAGLLQIASALAKYDTDSNRWDTICEKVVGKLVQENPLVVGDWTESLKPAKKHLIPALIKVFDKGNDASTPRAVELATEILFQYVDDHKTTHELVMLSQPREFAKFFPKYEIAKQSVEKLLRQELANQLPASNPERQRAIARQANAAVSLLRLGDWKSVYEFLTVERDPEPLSRLVYRISDRDVDPSLLVQSLQALLSMDPPKLQKPRQQHYYLIYAMLLALGEYPVDHEKLSGIQSEFIPQLASQYGEHPSRAVHSALGWLLRRWGYSELTDRVDRKPMDYDADGLREWFVLEIYPNTQKQVLDTSESCDDPYRFDPNAPVYFTMIAFPAVTQRTKQADGIELTEVFGPIAVCDRETTWRQFSPFDNDRYRNLKGLEYNKVFELDEPVVGVTWFDAVDYCNKLVEVRMGDASYQCYESAGDSDGRKANQVGLEPIDARHLERTWHPNRPGFRLLTELEWEYVARCGMDTPYCFGSSEDLLPEYGWFQVNANRQLHKVGLLRPSIGGLFDIHGNVWEWTNDWYTERSVRALRSGSFEFDASICTTGYREQGAPTVTRANRGFRIGIGPDRTQAAGTVCESIRVKFGIGQRTKVRFVMSEEHNNRFLAHPPTEPPFF